MPYDDCPYLRENDWLAGSCGDRRKAASFVSKDDKSEFDMN